MRLKKVMAIALCSAMVVTGSGISTMAGAVVAGVAAEESQNPEEEETTAAETETSEEGTTEPETEATEEGTTEAETEAAEENTTEAETDATEEGTTEAETEATGEGTTEAETEATEEGTTEAETGVAEKGTTEAETEAAEKGTTEAETEATTEAETKVSEETEAPMLMNLELEEESSEVTVSNEEELRAAVGQSGTIIINNEIELTDTLVIDSAVEIIFQGDTICLGDNKDIQHMISVQNGADVTLDGIEIDATKQDYISGIGVIEGKYNKSFSSIVVFPDSTLTIEGETAIKSNAQDTPKNDLKQGVFTTEGSSCTLNDGTITGFINGGLTVCGDLTMNGGNLMNNRTRGGGLQIADTGQVFMHGGVIEGNILGILNAGKFFMYGGEISGNDTGIFSNNEDGMTGEQFYPEAEITGGRIVNNYDEAIINTTRSKLKISGDAEVGGKIVNEEGSQFELAGNANVYSEATNNANVRAMAVSEETPFIISNDSDAELIISGGTITSNVGGEIAVWNGDKGKMSMTGGSIITNGDNAVAVMNINKSVGAVWLSGGSISAVGTNSKILDNYGSATMDGVSIEKDGKTNFHFINVTPTDGGTVILPDSMVADGEEITVRIQPDSGYKISDVTVDGVSKGAVSTYILKVTGSHTITATFAQKSSSSGGNGGGGGGSSRSISTSTQSKIPETPGTWQQDQNGWKFALPTGAGYLNTWVYVKGQWYRIGLNGYMMQGWVVIDGKTYYLTPVTGEMKTGWFIDNGSYYYLDSTGAVTTGWVQVDGAWYYLNADGKMAVNTTTQDGYQVGADGKRI